MNKKYFLSLLWLALIFFLSACRPNVDTVFQKTEPTSTVRLFELLDEVPVFKEMFSNIDQVEFNQKLTKFLTHDQETSIFMLNQLSHLMRVNYHLPQFFNDVSGILELALKYYQNKKNRDELKQIDVAFTRFSEAEFRSFLKTISVGTIILSRAIYQIGNNIYFFSNAKSEPFVSLKIWRDCSISNKLFKNERPKKLNDSKNRETIYKIYEISRTIYCGLDDLSDNDFQSFFNQQSGRFKSIGISDLILLTKSLDIENAVDEFIDLIHYNRKKIIMIDLEMSEWLASSPEKTNLLNYAIEHLYPILFSKNRNALYEDGIELLDKGGAFLSTLNLGSSDQENKYLLEWLLVTIYLDLKKIKNLQPHTNLNLDGHLYNKINNLVSSSDPESLRSVFTQPICTSSHGWFRYFTRLECGRGYKKTDFRRFFDHSRFSFSAANSSYTSNFKGLFYDNGNNNHNDDGPMKALAYGTHGDFYGASLFRRSMKSKLAPVLGAISLDYAGESPMEGFLNNFYYDIVDQHYSIADKAWKVDRSVHGNTTLPVYLSRLQYSLLNLMIMNASAEYVSPTGSGASLIDESKRIPYLTHFLHTLAGAMGYLDFEAGPAKQTLETSLRAVQSTDLADDGVQTTKKGGQTVHAAVICKPDQDHKIGNDSVCDTILKNSIFRNGNPYMLTSSMPVYELLTPGAFFLRNSRAHGQLDGNIYEQLAAPMANGWDYINRVAGATFKRYKGRFSVHQGDLVSTGARTAEWVMGQFQFFAWRGYGPYTVKGKAPNGSRFKYQNDFITDSYKVKVCDGSFHNWNMKSDQCKQGREKYYSLGNNGQTFNLSVGKSSSAEEGAVLMYENIYRPRRQGDPCWSNSGGDDYGYARYGYLRPSKSFAYPWNSNCSKWARIRVDFDSREQAIAENISWLISYKKFVLITPNSVYGNKKIGFNHHGASLGIFNIAVGNGLQGFVSAKLAGTGNAGCRGGDKHRCNGVWNNDASYNMMASSDSDGWIPTSAIATYAALKQHGWTYGRNGKPIKNLVYFGRTSFEPGDSALIVDYAVHNWGFATSGDAKRDIFKNINRPDTDFASALSPLLSLASKYRIEDIVDSILMKATSSFTKFKSFFNRYFPNDQYRINSDTLLVSGSNGISDVIDKWKVGIQYRGCLDTNGNRIALCLTDQEMPYVPHVAEVSYPSSYNSDGSASSWSVSAYSELKFSAFISLLVQMMGTFHESGEIFGVKDRTGKNCFNHTRFNPNGSRTNARDDHASCIYYFANDGFRRHIHTFLTGMVSLNETKQTSIGAITPLYNKKALLNQLIESSPGLRDGPLVSMLRDFNVANFSYFKNEIKKLTKNNLESILGQFDLLSKEGGVASGLNHLRYFLTKNVVDEGIFDSNHLGGVDIVTRLSLSKNPLLMLKNDLLPYLRRLTSDEELKNSLIQSFDLVNDYLISIGRAPLSINSNSIDELLNKFKKLLHKKTASNTVTNYFLDNILQKLIDSGYDDPTKLYEIDIFALPDNLPVFASWVKDSFNYDLEANIFSDLVGDYTCNGNSFYDVNKNNSFDEGLFIFNGGSYESVGNSCNLKDKQDYYNLGKYQINIHYLSRNINQWMKDVDSSQFDSIVDNLYSLPNNLTEKITELKDEAITNFMTKPLQEIGTDSNGNGSIDDSDNYFDFNNDGEYGQFTFPELIDFIRNTMKASLFEEKAGKTVVNQTIKGSLQTVDELLNLRNVNCLSNNANCSYITSSLVNLQAKFAEITKFTSKDLQALKNLISIFVYDKTENRPTYLLNTMASSLAPMMFIFKGKYDKLFNLFDYALREDGFLTFMGNSLVLPEGYSLNDLLTDFQVLLNTKVIREYDHPETFWWQFGELIGGVSGYIAEQNGYSWETENNYYERIANLFSYKNDEFILKNNK